MKNARLKIIMMLFLFCFTSTLMAKEAPKEKPSEKKKEIKQQAPVDLPAPKEMSFVPNENDVKSFVYRWFSWLGHQVDDFLFLYHLSKDDLVMKLPEQTIKNQNDFKKWYQGVRENIKSNTYDVGDIKVKMLPKNRYKVDLSVYWKAKDKLGKTLEMKQKQSWVLSLSAAGRLTINRYIVKKVK